MTLLHTEVAVVGGGMVGGALALGLAQQGFEVTVIEQAAPLHSIPRANRMCASWMNRIRSSDSPRFLYGVF